MPSFRQVFQNPFSFLPAILAAFLRIVSGAVLGTLAVLSVVGLVWLARVLGELMR